MGDHEVGSYTESLYTEVHTLRSELALVTAERDAAQRALANLGSVVAQQSAEIAASRAVVEAAERASMCITCSRDRGYMAPHKKCRSCASCKAATTLGNTLDALHLLKTAPNNPTGNT